LQGMNF